TQLLCFIKLRLYDVGFASRVETRVECLLIQSKRVCGGLQVGNVNAACLEDVVMEFPILVLGSGAAGGLGSFFRVRVNWQRHVFVGERYATLVSRLEPFQIRLHLLAIRAFVIRVFDHRERSSWSPSDWSVC